MKGEEGMSFIIRDAIPADLPALLDIYNSEVENGTATFDINKKTLDQWNDWYEEHTCGNKFVLTAEADGRAVGYASLSRYRAKEAYAATTELSVYVHEYYRGRGIATALIGETIKKARENGNVHTIISVITGGNEASIHLHEKLGFVHCGTIRQVGVKFGRLLDIDNFQIII